MNGDTTIREMMREAIERAGDDEADVVCYWQPRYDRYFNEPGEPPPPITQCAVADLPERPFDGGFGGEEGERIFAFSPRYVYVKHVYDGAESIHVVPRHPEHIGSFIWPIA